MVALRGTGVRIARLGLGCARLFGGVEAMASARLVEAALAAGVVHFDTAPSYAYGQSEEVLGDVLAGVAGVTVATKVGLNAIGAPSRAGTLYRRLVRPALARTPALKSALLRARRRTASESRAVSRRVLGTDEIEASVDSSLARLQRSRIDILLVHEPDQFVIDEALRERLEALVRNGTIAAYGLAYGRSVAGGAPFGHILQSAYDPTTPAWVGPPVPIYHGVLRGRARTTPREAVRAVLQAQRDAVVLVSASTPFQIREVSAQD
jgi:aryl-alcohol dehydrogenase-like predicted oxidoreductase